GPCAPEHATTPLVQVEVPVWHSPMLGPPHTPGAKSSSILPSQSSSLPLQPSQPADCEQLGTQPWQLMPSSTRPLQSSSRPLQTSAVGAPAVALHWRPS